MRVRRRTLIAGAVALCAGGGLVHMLRPRTVRGFVEARLADEFGVDPAGDPEAAAFVDAFLGWVDRVQLGPTWATVAEPLWARLSDARQREREAVLTRLLVEVFLTGTDWILAQEAGRPLRFVAIHDPYETPCASQLTAWA
jgi:hypothetical protein